MTTKSYKKDPSFEVFNLLKSEEKNSFSKSDSLKNKRVDFEVSSLLMNEDDNNQKSIEHYKEHHFVDMIEGERKDEKTAGYSRNKTLGFNPVTDKDTFNKFIEKAEILAHGFTNEDYLERWNRINNKNEKNRRYWRNWKKRAEEIYHDLHEQQIDYRLAESYVNESVTKAQKRDFETRDKYTQKNLDEDIMKRKEALFELEKHHALHEVLKGRGLGRAL